MYGTLIAMYRRNNRVSRSVRYETLTIKILLAISTVIWVGLIVSAVSGVGFATEGSTAWFITIAVVNLLLTEVWAIFFFAGPFFDWRQETPAMRAKLRKYYVRLWKAHLGVASREDFFYFSQFFFATRPFLSQIEYLTPRKLITLDRMNAGRVPMETWETMSRYWDHTQLVDLAGNKRTPLPVLVFLFTRGYSEDVETAILGNPAVPEEQKVLWVLTRI